MRKDTNARRIYGYKMDKTQINITPRKIKHPIDEMPPINKIQISFSTSLILAHFAIILEHFTFQNSFTLNKILKPGIENILVLISLQSNVQS